MKSSLLQAKTLGELKKSGYQLKSVKTEIRDNLIQKLKSGEKVFEGIFGYQDTVVPDIERALLSEHNILLLGLRGQAKTRIARLITQLMDEYIPIIKGSEINDHPYQPISKYGRDLISELGDETPIEWIERSERYTEKLATPDVTVADLIGDVDPIKAATLKLPYSDERVIHYGLIPRSHRGIFVINELPDLQPRIQVSLFNILQVEDIQIRGFKLRLPLDVVFIFTANPEDYTNRGSIVTPLKDRIESQIITHYPKDLETGLAITAQEAKVKEARKSIIKVNDLSKELIELIAIEARKSEYVDPKSGVSARLTISAMENLYSAAERRMILNNEDATHVRLTDFDGIIPSITGKIELVYEGEQEGAGSVSRSLVSKALRKLFSEQFPDPDSQKKKKVAGVYEEIIQYFNKEGSVDVLNNFTRQDYEKTLNNISGLKELVKKYHPGINKDEQLFMMEFVLYGLAEYSLISKAQLERGLQFKDIMSGYLNLDFSEN